MSQGTVLVLLGVSGSGKSRLGHALAQSLDGEFLDGDDFHPAANKEKMSRGVALTDEDRRPWLEAMAREIKNRLQRPGTAIFACSGLKRAYRHVLRVERSVHLFLLDCTREVLEQRLKTRRGHFFPASLLDTQLATLERPDPEEGVHILNGDNTIDDLVNEIRHSLHRRAGKESSRGRGE